MNSAINTNKLKHTGHQQSGNALFFSTYFFLIVLIVFSYRAIFTRYGLINNIALRHKLYQSEVVILDMTAEKKSIQHKIYLIKNNDTDLIEELSIRYMNKIPPETKVLIE